MSKTNTRLLLGAAILAVIFVLGVVMPLFAPEDPRIWNTQPRNLKPSVDHLLGTTNLGQDTFWLLAWSTRNSLIIGFLVAIAATVIGVLAGMTAGFVGGVVDRVLTLLMDVFIVVPSLILILLAPCCRARRRFISSAAFSSYSTGLGLPGSRGRWPSVCVSAVRPHGLVLGRTGLENHHPRYFLSLRHGLSPT